MSLVRFKAQNHQQQLVARGPRLDVDERITEPAWFAALDRRFHFTIDVAALARNTKCERFYSPDDNGLDQPWAGERVWCNPPFSSIEPWVVKAWAEVDAPLIVMLVPANRTEQPWWQELVEPHRDGGGRLSVEFLAGRIRFLLPGQVTPAANTRPPFGCALLIWSSRVAPS
jgi:phage N-6-adenine-methyltransferase